MRSAPQAISGIRSSSIDLRQSIGDTPAVPAPGLYAGLWLALTCISAMVMLDPGRLAVYEPRLSMALDSVSCVVGFALLQLGLLRFRVFRRSIDLHAALAFGALAQTSLFAVWAPLAAGVQAHLIDRSAYFLVLMRGIAVALFLCGLFSSAPEEGPSRRSPWCGRLGVTAASGLGLLALGVLISPIDLFPSPLELMLANAVLAVGLLVSAVGYMAAGQRLQDPHICALAGALILLFFAQLNTVPVAALPAEYVTSGDVLPLVAYVLLLSTLIWRTAREFAANASHDERLRLSRELHDGLAQHVSVSQLRLARVIEDTARSDPRRHDLEVAQRMLDSASIEARGAISALRSEVVAWRDFEQALLAFADEFSVRHDVEARVCIGPFDGHVDSQLEVDALRILQEAFSNAARHGHATHVHASVIHAVDGLHISIRDNGTGFDPVLIRGGVGLRSMKERVDQRGGVLLVQSADRQGTTIEAHLPHRRERGGPA